jgi:predicted amidophosphoribosyltransferase
MGCSVLLHEAFAIAHDFLAGCVVGEGAELSAETLLSQEAEDIQHPAGAISQHPSSHVSISHDGSSQHTVSQLKAQHASFIVSLLACWALAFIENATTNSIAEIIFFMFYLFRN